MSIDRKDRYVLQALVIGITHVSLENCQREYIEELLSSLCFSEGYSLTVFFAITIIIMYLYGR